MSLKYPKNAIIGVSVVAALLAGTVLLGSYAGSKPADSDASVKACQATGNCCPMTAASASCPKMMASQAKSTDCPKTPCTTCCPKPCCVGEKAEAGCDNPCPIPCPKPCCAEDAPQGCCGTAEAAGCYAAEAAAQ